MLKVYVGGASAEIERIEKWVRALREAGVTVVSTWVEEVRKVGTANPMHIDRAERADWAAQDLYELGAATLLWMLLPHGVTSHGAYTELGYALRMRTSRLNPPLDIITSGPEQSIFTSLVVNYATDEEAFREVVRLNAG
jgi:hypothetical protein